MQWVACGLSNTIRGAVLKCAKKLTQVSLIYRTNQQLKSGKQKKPKKYKTDMLRSTDKQSGESVVSRERRKGTLYGEGFAENDRSRLANLTRSLFRLDITTLISQQS